MSVNITVQQTLLDTPKADRSREIGMGWAKHAPTGELRFIAEVPELQTGLKCDCVCYGCGDKVQAVNAGKQHEKIKREPHFRHDEHKPDSLCRQKLAHALLMRELQELKSINMPARAVEVTLRGLSGKAYTQTVTVPAVRHTVRDASMHSEVDAVLTLDDDRQVLVKLVGRLNLEESDLPTIQILVDDAKASAMSQEELRQRITVLVGSAKWSGPLLDNPYTTNAQSALRRQAISEFELIPDGVLAELGPNPTRETFIHWSAKEILAELSEIALPELSIPWYDRYRTQGLAKSDFHISGTTVQLSHVQLEKSLERTRPDVLAEASGEPTEVWSGPLAIEVTVSNAISNVRRWKIKQDGVPSVEIDLSEVARDLNYDALVEIVVRQTEHKKWLYHPSVVAMVQKAQITSNEGLDALTDAALALRYSEYFIKVHINDFFLGNEKNESQEHKSNQAKLQAIAKEFSSRGIVGAEEALGSELGQVLERLYSIKLNRVVGHRVETVWQVLNALDSRFDLNPARRYDYLYLMAITTSRYKPNTSGFAKFLVKLRDRVQKGVRDVRDVHYPDFTANEFLAHLFPEMAEHLRWRNRDAAGALHNKMLNALRSFEHPFLQKDLRKAVHASKFIGRGSSGSSTNRYRAAAGTSANTSRYDSRDIVFVSAEGNRRGRLRPDFAELALAVDAGVTFVTDAAEDRGRPFNLGEREVAEFLRLRGFDDAGTGKWTLVT